MGNFVFINFSTKNVVAAREFYTKVGFDINQEYSSERNTFVIIAENVQLILSDEAFLQEQGEQREFADATKVTEASVAISVDSREEVDRLFDAAIVAGGKDAGKVEEAEIGLYAHAFFDLDGHKIDINHMSMA